MGEGGTDMKIVFFGTPEYVLPVLESIHKVFGVNLSKSPITAVVTQKPKPVGRKQMLMYSPVDNWAHKHKVPIYFDPRDIISEKIEADLGVLASYGNIIPKEVIKYFPYGILVIHPSLLPQFRFSSPVPAAIITDTNPTGISIIKMDEKLDHGQIVTQSKEEILPDDTYASLRDRLFAKSSKVLVSMLPAYIKGKINLKPQDDSKATFARMIGKEDAYIPPEYLNACLQGKTLKREWKIPFIKNYSLVPSAYSFERFVRAMQPWPGAWTTIRIKNQELRIKILKAHLDTKDKTPYLVLDSVQLEGKNPVTWKQFEEGYPTATLE